MDVLELIRRGYAALGLGADADVLAMFDQLGEAPSHWMVYRASDVPHKFPARDVAAMELFGGLPAHFELTGVRPESWRVDRKGRHLTVSGHYRVRPRGTWETLSLPFVHVWWIGSGRVERVLSVIDGVELRRLRAAA
jgi:hypothetical protein